MLRIKRSSLAVLAFLSPVFVAQAQDASRVVQGGGISVPGGTLQLIIT